MEGKCLKRFFRDYYHLFSQFPKNHCFFKLKKRNCVIQKSVCEREIGVICPVSPDNIIFSVVDSKVCVDILFCLDCNLPINAEATILQQYIKPVQNVIFPGC